LSGVPVKVVVTKHGATVLSPIQFKSSKVETGILYASTEDNGACKNVF